MVWNRWREENPNVVPDLSGATLSDTVPAYPRKARAPEANLQGINLSDTNLSDSYLRGVNLRKSNLCRINLDKADLRRANLQGVNAAYAHFTHANLTLADLRAADITNALFWETVLSRVNFMNVVGLDSCRHGGPSVIDHRTIQTLQKSGQLPESFLRGVGLPETFIHNLPMLLNQSSYPRASSATRSKMRHLRNSLATIYKTRAYAVGLLRTAFKVVRRLLSKLLKQ